MAAGAVAVVGAGLAGLAATTELSRMGLRVELFERSRLLGGKATSFSVNGEEIDNGQHVFLGCFSEFLSFVDRLGLRDQLYLQPRFQVLLLTKGGQPRQLRAANLPPPLHLLPVLAGYPSLTWRQKRLLAGAILGARSAPTLPSPGSFADWLERHGQDKAIRRHFWEPFLVPALNAGLDDVSAEAGLFVVRTAFLGGTGNARIGYSRIPLAGIAAAAARQASAVHLRTPVSGITIQGGRATGIQLDGGRRLDVDAVVLAIPPAAVRRLLGEPERYGINGLERLQTGAIVDVHLWYEGADFGFDFAALLDSPIQWIFRKGRGYLCCSLSSAETVSGRTEQELIDLCHSELSQALPLLQSARPLRGVATRDREATLIPAPGIARPGPSTTIPNLVIAGAWTNTGWPATMESAVRSGLAAARLVAPERMQRAA